MDLLKRFLTARIELQAALMASLNFAQLAGVLGWDEDMISGANLLLLVWMAFVSKIAFGKDIEALTEGGGDI